MTSAIVMMMIMIMITIPSITTEQKVIQRDCLQHFKDFHNHRHR
jgi:hypothetical protein